MLSGDKKINQTASPKTASKPRTASSPASDSSDYYKEQIHILKKQLRDLSNMVGIHKSYIFLENCELSPYKVKSERKIRILKKLLKNR